MRSTRLLLNVSSLCWLGFAASVTGCGDDDDDPPVSVAGSYTVNTTNGASSCSAEWEEGATASNIPLVITQDGNQVTGTLGGLAAVYYTLVIGTPEFKGTVSGNHLQLVAYGTRSQTQGNCTFTYNATLDAQVSGAILQGTIKYAPATNNNPDCADVSCQAVQNFNGSRPP